MCASAVFRAVIEPSLDRVPVIETRHTETHAGRDIVVSHIVRRNVFTAFDEALSRHLAATTGRGFPAVAVAARWRPHATAEPWRELEQGEQPSVPHALAAIARRALAGRESAVMRLHHHDLALSERSVSGMRRLLKADELAALERALEVAAMLGEQPFLEVSGDFDLVVLRAPDPALAPIVFDLVTGRVTVGDTTRERGSGLHGTVYDADQLFESEGEGRVYLAALRRALVAAKQDAVLDFRAAAEKRILDFDAALAGRALAGHRLEAATSLVWRLKAGLGDSLSGLSEHAQLTAFDWDAEIQRDGAAEVWPGPGAGAEAARAYA